MGELIFAKFKRMNALKFGVPAEKWSDPPGGVGHVFRRDLH